MAANPRVICHFTPTHASWLNLVVGDLGEEHGHRVLRVHGKGGKVVLVPLPPALGRAIDRAVDKRTPDRSC